MSSMCHGVYKRLTRTTVILLQGRRRKWQSKANCFRSPGLTYASSMPCGRTGRAWIQEQIIADPRIFLFLITQSMDGRAEAGEDSQLLHSRMPGVLTDICDVRILLQPIIILMLKIKIPDSRLYCRCREEMEMEEDMQCSIPDYIGPQTLLV